MTTHTPVIVLQATRPDEVAAWKAEQDALVATFEKNLAEFQNAVGASEVWYTTTTSGLQLTGWDWQRPDADLPPGWRRDTKGERAIVPALRTKEGKAHAARMKDASVVLPPAPGLPEAVWGEGFRGQFRIEQLNSRWYAWLGFNLKQDQTDRRKSTPQRAEEALAREIQRMRDDHLHGDIKAVLVQGHRFSAHWIYQLSPAIHPEQALFQAGVSDGHCYEIVGASYTPADAASGARETATIDLSTADHTGGLLTHDYGTSITTLAWDDDYTLSGTDEDIATAVEDITRGRLDSQQLFTAFREQMAGAGVTQ